MEKLATRPNHLGGTARFVVSLDILIHSIINSNPPSSSQFVEASCEAYTFLVKVLSTLLLHLVKEYICIVSRIESKNKTNKEKQNKTKTHVR